eukprot:CAMPEP_0117676768 /NCGR_PEP_ID=MMETSP0804-20121206/16376_1 /TAXON_ID=1074897 /ORGANISM="Tetraselmis astigmatica, Strain CCMP880" /LENGTH=35 /DNA_ID= /DNA_START= /DNA_END= /DNA_ORIENTATION=
MERYSATDMPDDEHQEVHGSAANGDEDGVHAGQVL